MSASKKKDSECAGCDNVEEQIEAVAEEIERVKEDVERRHGDRRRDCPTTCPAHLEAVRLISDMAGTIRNSRWTYGVVSALVVLSLTFLINGQNDKIEDNTVAIKELHDAVHVRFEDVRVLQQDHEHIRAQIDAHIDDYKNLSEELERHLREDEKRFKEVFRR